VRGESPAFGPVCPGDAANIDVLDHMGCVLKWDVKKKRQNVLLKYWNVIGFELLMYYWNMIDVLLEYCDSENLFEAID
jgi:hypothetical protein